MSGSLIDSNVLLDIATEDRDWMAWSQEQLAIAIDRGPVFVNPIIYSEIAPNFGSAEELDHWLDPALYHRVALPFEAAWIAAKAFVQYRRAGGPRTTPLPDFYIGAHAQVANLILVTRDIARYRSYFAGLSIISP